MRSPFIPVRCTKLVLLGRWEGVCDGGTYAGSYFTNWNVGEKRLTARLPQPGYFTFGLSREGSVIAAGRDDGVLTRFELGGDRPKDVTELYRTRAGEAVRGWVVTRQADFAREVGGEDWCRPVEPNGGLRRYPVEGYPHVLGGNYSLEGVNLGKLLVLRVERPSGGEDSVWDFGSEPPKRVTASTPWPENDLPTYITTDAKFLVTHVRSEGLTRLWRIADGTLKKLDEIQDDTAGVNSEFPGWQVACLPQWQTVHDISEEGKFRSWSPPSQAAMIAARVRHSRQTGSGWRSAATS